ncbi:MAG: methyltransferase domain-containing protein [Planctomycetota bacterium]|nr:MAG: methyltransferase domain-containing protein [Planctomycetota bacterium]
MRVLTPERMDDPDATRADLDASLRFIRVVNRRLGGSRALIRHLAAWSRRWPRDRPVTLLDVGTGSADIPLAAVRWARRRGFDLRVTAVDLHATTLALAREHVRDEPAITLEQADARRLTDRYADDSFDYAHAGMFLHHLPEIEVLTVLRMMDRVARAGIVWNDLVRSPLARLGVRVLTLGRPEIVRHDARVSVDAGFTAAEARDLARRLGLGHCRVRAGLWTQRFTLAGERPGAWASAP